MQEILKELERKYPLTTKELAQRVRLHRTRVQQLTIDLQEADLAIFIGQTWRFKQDAVGWFQRR